jgi:hypothetical protein
MPTFSRRFWQSLITHDRRLAQASSKYEVAAGRLRASGSCLTKDAQLEFRLELLESVVALRGAVTELRQFTQRHAASQQS